MKRNLSAITSLFALLFISAAVYGDFNDVYDVDLLKSVEDLQTQVMDLKNQYVSITSSLERIQLEIPRGLQNFPDLFYIEGQNLVVGPDGNIYYNDRDIGDYVNIMGIQPGNTGDTSDSDPNPSRASYVTMEQFNQLADLVFTLSATCQTLSANLTSLQNTVSSISASQSSLQNSLQSLTASYNQLNELCNSLTSAVKVNSDGSVVIAKSSPIVGRIEPTTGASYWQPAVDGGWNRAGNTFRVLRNTQLESVTLYCDNVTRILLPQNVCIAACEVNGGIPQINEYNAASINTSDFPRITYSFSSPVPISADRDYLLCVKTLDNAPLYVYTCPNIRYGEFYKPYGASDGPRGGGNDSNSDDGYVPETPRSGSTPQQWFYEYLNACWSLTYTTQDIWSIFKFSDDESFTFTEGGLALESGNITVGGSEVVTSSSLGNMFVNMLSAYPDLLNSKITWNMFCDALKEMLITTAGGTVTGPLSVNDLQINGSGDWIVGNTSNPCDIVIANEQGKISAPNGDLTLLATEGGNIQAQSFLQLQNTTQCGIVDIPVNECASSSIACPGLTSSAIILLTPRQETTVPYWVETDASAESFKVHRPSDGDNLESASFNYLMIRK